MRIKRIIARRLTAVALSLGMGAALALAPSAPASAGNFDGNCQSGEVCVWYYVGYTGAMADFYNNVSNYSGWHFWNSSLWLNNNTRSAKNQAYFSCLDMFDNANYSGQIVFMYSSSENGNFGAANDRVTSHKFVSSFPQECQL